MSGLTPLGGASSSGSSTQTGTLGNVPPISFPGIASGIDYNAIIEKLTSLTLAQNAPLQAENQSLAKQNAELAKINSLITEVQSAIQNLGDASLFNSFSATPSNSAFATATQTAGSSPTVGTYTILSQTLATSTQINGDPAANKTLILANPLQTAGFQITPSNGTGGAGGKFTVDGNQISFDVGTDTVATILGKLNGIPGVNATFQNDQLTLTSTGGPLSLGSASDSGDLEQIFKLDTAQIVGGQQALSTTGGVAATDTLGGDGVTTNGTLTLNGTVNVAYTTGETVGALITAINANAGYNASIQGGKLVIETTNGNPLALTETGGGDFLVNFNGGIGAAANYQSVTSAATVGGINPNTTLNVVNATTPLNGGTTFTINGVGITIQPGTQSLQDVINAINTSNAGVIASWNTTLGQLQIVAKATGPQSVVLGAPGDSSNFLTTFGLITAGATTTTGSQASVTYQSASGNPVTVFSNSNQVTNVIPGVTLTLQQTTPNPYTVTVAQSNTNLITQINAFVKAYNAAIQEINSATTPPVVQTAQPGTPIQPGTTQSSVTVPGGVLFNNTSVQNLKDQLVNMVSSLVQTGSSSYNSFSSIGLALDSSISVISSNSTAGTNNTDSKDSSNGGLQTQTFDGTSGQLGTLDTTTLDSALAADPQAVQTLFTGSQGVLAQLGTYMTFVTGTPTALGPTGTFLATVPDVSLLQSIENSNSAQIDSINQQITTVNDMATAQANQLRAQFNASETLIAQLQQEQQSLSSILGSSSTSSSGSG